MIKIINIIKYASFALLTIPLLSCATPYEKAGEVGGFRHGGYKNSMVNGNTAIVSFDASSSTAPDQVRKFMLYRAAEMTIENGYDYFVVISSSVSRTNIDLKVKEVEKPMSPNFTMANSHYEVEQIKSYKLSQTRATQCGNSNTSPCTAHSRTAVIKMFGGAIPSGLPGAYKALDVIAHYGPGT